MCLFKVSNCNDAKLKSNDRKNVVRWRFNQDKFKESWDNIKLHILFVCLNIRLPLHVCTVLYILTFLNRCLYISHYRYLSKFISRECLSHQSSVLLPLFTNIINIYKTKTKMNLFRCFFVCKHRKQNTNIINTQLNTFRRVQGMQRVFSN